jgi:methylated-DNA-[protein]-cysteine S-methyltransferase
MHRFVFDSPIGPIGIETEDQLVTAIELMTDWKSAAEPSPIALQTMHELRLYFAGKLQKFSVPFPIKGTKFKQKVLNALLAIPYGETRSYGDVAKMIGAPKAYRAVGTACATNDIPLLIPCHRVIKSDHTIGGFATRVDIKQQLIDLEKSHK